MYLLDTKRRFRTAAPQSASGGPELDCGCPCGSAFSIGGHGRGDPGGYRDHPQSGTSTFKYNFLTKSIQDHNTMEIKRDFSVQYSTEIEYSSLYKWCLKQIQEDGTQIGSDLIPWIWSILMKLTTMKLIDSWQLKTKLMAVRCSSCYMHVLKVSEFRGVKEYGCARAFNEGMAHRRTHRLTSASTTYPDVCLMSEFANILSLTLEYSTQRFRNSKSIGESFQRFVRFSS